MVLPYKEIWDNITHIQAFKLPCNMKSSKDKIDLTLDDFKQLKDEFFMTTVEYAQNIDEITIGHNTSIDFTFRYKEDNSIERNWNKDDIPKPLFKILNDILGMRFVLPVNREVLSTVVRDFSSSCPLGEDKCRTANLERDGYHGLHLYIRFNNQVFPVEVQFWSRVDALLNQYLRDTIYTRFDDPEIITYANSLRQWLEGIPSFPEGSSIKPYVDYLYEKAFQHHREDI